MKIQIASIGDKIGVSKDYRETNKSEIAHILIEVEVIKQELLDLWRKVE